MRWHRADCTTLRQTERIAPFGLRAIQYHNDQRTCRTRKRGRLQIIAIGSAEDSPRAGADETTEMSQVIIRTLEDQFVMARVGDNRRAAKITDMIGAARL